MLLIITTTIIISNKQNKNLNYKMKIKMFQFNSYISSCKILQNGSVYRNACLMEGYGSHGPFHSILPLFFVLLGLVFAFVLFLLCFAFNNTLNYYVLLDSMPTEHVNPEY